MNQMTKQMENLEIQFKWINQMTRDNGEFKWTNRNKFKQTNQIE